MEERSVELARRLVEVRAIPPPRSPPRWPVSDPDRDLPGRERPHLRRAGRAQRPLSADHRLDDRASGKACERPLPQLQPFLKSPDRAVRERAFRAASQPISTSRRNSRRSSTGCTQLRMRAAQNAGFANFRDYIFPAKFRFDYTPADCERFHAAIEQTVAPAVERVLESRRRAAGPRPAPSLGPGGRSLPAPSRCGPFAQCRPSWSARPTRVRAGGSRRWAGSSRP